MRGVIPPQPQYAFVAGSQLKESQEQFYLYLPDHLRHLVIVLLVVTSVAFLPDSNNSISTSPARCKVALWMNYRVTLFLRALTTFHFLC